MLKLDFTANSGVHFVPVSILALRLTVSFCARHVFSDIFLPYFGEFPIMLILSNYKLVLELMYNYHKYCLLFICTRKVLTEIIVMAYS